MPEYTTKLNLPKPLGNENFNRANYNALIDAIDSKAGASGGLAQLDASGKVPASQLNVSAPADATTTTKGVVQLSNSTTSTEETKAATPKAVKDVADRVGPLANLVTTNKTNLVNAVNELFTDVGDGKALLETTIESKGGTVSDVNEPPTWQDLVTGVNTILSEITGETVKAAKFTETIAKGERVNVFYDGGASTALANPDVLPTGNADAVAWSPDGRYLAVASFNAPHLVLYKRTGDTLTKLANPATLPTGAANGSKALAWSPDGKYFAVAHIASPYLTIYEQIGDTFTKLANPSTLPVGTGNAVAWSPDGKTLVVGSNGTNRLIRYSVPSFFGTTFGASSDVSSVSFSPDGSILMTSVNGASNVYLIRYNALRNYAQSNDLNNATSGSVTSTAWSSDGQYLAVGSNTLYIFKYNKATDTFTSLTGNITGGTVTSAYGVSWSADDRYLLVSGDVSPYIYVFKRTGDTFARQPNPAVLPTAFAYSAAYSPTGQYLTVGFRATPFVRTYKASDSAEKNNGNIPRATRLGYAKEGGTSGQTKNVGILFE